MSDLSELQQKAFVAVLAWGAKKPWFKGVCMDNFPDDVALTEDFAAEVGSVCFETAMYDDPNFYTSLMD